MVDYADIGKRIRACRLAKGMTQEQLANEVGVVVTHISHIETGNSVPSLKTLIDIINALDCSADELLCIEIKKAKPVFDSWMTEQLADCSSDEAKIIKETVVSLKNRSGRCTESPLNTDMTKISKTECQLVGIECLKKHP